MRRAVRLFARKHQTHVAAHRKAYQVNGHKTVLRSQLAQDGTQVARQCAVVECRRQVFGLAAGAQVQADDVEACAESLLGSAEHIDGRVRALKTVYQKNGRVREFIFLPATMCEES